MIRSILLVASLLLAGAASALQPPLRVHYQGRLSDADGAPRTGLVALNFRIYDSPIGGTPLWNEAHPQVAVMNGVFSVELGSWTALSPDAFAAGAAWLEVDVNPAGAEPLETLAPRHELTAAAQAFSAAQLAAEGPLTMRAGVAYSTFTSDGRWLVPYGVRAATMAVSGGITASSATFKASGDGQYSVYSASGILIGGGTLLVNAGAGLSARYGVTAATLTLTGTGNALYALEVSSGLAVRGGTLLADGGGGLAVRYGAAAATGTFSLGSDTQYGVDAASGAWLREGSLQVGASDARTVTEDAAGGGIAFSSHVVVQGSMTANNFNMVLLASMTRTAVGTTLDVSFFNDRYSSLRIVVLIAGVAAATNVTLRFNNDAAANYSRIASDIAGAPTSNTAQTSITLQEGTNAYQGLFEANVRDVPTLGKTVFWRGARGNLVTTAPVFFNGAGLWANTTAWVSRVTFTGTQNFSIGSGVRVFGVR